jgi:hypothetical protein
MFCNGDYLMLSGILVLLHKLSDKVSTFNDTKHCRICVTVAICTQPW